MAMQPLVMQQPRQSLIGGKELPKASIADVRAPDISNAFNGMMQVAQEKASRNKAIDDKLQADADVATFAAENTGKGPDERYRTLPVVNGSPAYRIAALQALEDNAIADITSMANTKFGEYQAGQDPTPVKLGKMRSYKQGVIDNLAPAYKGRAEAYFASEIQQRENFLVGEDDRRQEAAMYTGLEETIETNIKQAVSAGAAGADYTEYTQKIYGAQDRLAQLGKITQETADQRKEAIGRIIMVSSIQDRLANGAITGNIPVDQIGKLGLVLQTGGDAEVTYDDDYNPDRVNVDPKYDTGQNLTRRTVVTADSLRKMIGDPTAIAQVAADLQKLHSALTSESKANEKERLLADFFRAAPAMPTKVLPLGLRSTYEEGIDLQINQNDAMSSPEGRRALVEYTLAGRYMAPSFTHTLKTWLHGSMEEAQVAVAIWHAIRTSKQGNINTGEIIARDMDQGDVAELDGQRNAMNDIMSSRDPNAAATWRRVQEEVAKPGNDVGHFKDEYYAKTQISFDTAVRTAVINHYGVTSLDGPFLKEAEQAFRNSMVLTPNPDPATVLTGVMERMFSRYSKSKIWVSGFARSQLLENPQIEGYRQSTIPGTGIGVPFTAPDPDQWANDFTVDQIHHFLDDGQLVLDDSEVKQRLDEVLAAGSGVVLGKDLFFQTTGTNMDSPQVEVMLRMRDNTYHKLQVKVPNGRPAPLLLDPSLLLTNINTRQKQGEEINKEASDQLVRRDAEIRKQYMKTRPDWSGAGGLKGIPGSPVPGMDITNDFDEKQFREWFAHQPEEWIKAYQADEASRIQNWEKQLQRYRDLPPVVPEGMTVDPALLGSPKVIGEAAVIGAVQAVGAVFGDDQNTQQFLVNVASGESDFGRAENTFRESGDRGLFQINDTGDGAFVEIQRRARIEGDPMNIAARKLKQALGIDIATVAPSDLDKPIVGAALARLYILRNGHKVPTDAQAQGEYWRSQYNPNAFDKNVADWVSKANRAILPTAAQASTQVPAGHVPGAVIDMQGKANPANFLAMQGSAQASALRLASAFGQPLRITPHGGTQGDARKSTSQHHKGTAIDIYVADMDDATKTRLVATAIKMGYRGIGGYGAGDGKGTVHFDLRPGGKHNGLALWWRNRPGVDDNWTSGQPWFVAGVKEGMALAGRYSA